MRLKILTSFFQLLVHVNLVLFFAVTCDLIRAPCLQSATWWVLGGLSYLLALGVVNNLWPLTLSLLLPLRLFCWVGLLILVGMSGYQQDGVLGRQGLCLATNVAQTVLFPLGTMTVLQTVSYFAVDAWVKGQVFGAVDLWLVFSACVQALVYMAVPLFFEFAVREWIAASFQSQDSDSLIQGFRQMLKGISDGELLLDGSFQICGSAPCLQRLLSSREDFAGRSFRELIVDDEAKELFDHFLAPAASDGEDPETTVQLGSSAAPRCLRVPLRDCAGRAISVDVFHVSLQPCLYGECTCHLQLGLFDMVSGWMRFVSMKVPRLALKEDVRSVEPPEASS